jgi:hypothetical protein
MREFLTHHDIANTIRMASSNHKGSFLVVEGETDSRTYENFIHSNECQVIVAHNKDNAIEATYLLDKDKKQGILTIVDADFLFLESILPSSDNILYTDTHDLETMILRTSSFDKLLREMGSKRKISKFKETQGKDIRTILLDSGAIIGYLRWISKKDNLNLKFKGISFREFTDKDSISIDITKLITSVQNNSNRTGLFIPGLKSKIKMLVDQNHDQWHVCCGHDLINLLSIGLQKAIGSHNSNQVSQEILERQLRLSYERSFFRRTQLYQSIRQWEKQNRPYKILAIGW